MGIKDIDDLEWHREHYNVPAKKGLHVLVGKVRGIIIGASGPHVRIQLEGAKHKSSHHPTEIT